MVSRSLFHQRHDSFMLTWLRIYTRSRKFAHTSYSLLHKQRDRDRPNYFKIGDIFYKICTSLPANFRKKYLIRYVLWKVSNFALIFYVMSVLHKKSKQSLRPSTGRIGWDFFSKIGIEWGTNFVKKVPNFEIGWPAPAMPRPLCMYIFSFPVQVLSCWKII